MKGKAALYAQTVRLRANYNDDGAMVLPNKQWHMCHCPLCPCFCFKA